MPAEPGSGDDFTPEDDRIFRACHDQAFRLALAGDLRDPAVRASVFADLDELDDAYPDEGTTVLVAVDLAHHLVSAVRLIAEVTGQDERVVLADFFALRRAGGATP